MASPESPRHTLSKEVLPPQKPQNGVGVMLVAAAAMFFAVASSALILRSRMAGECCPSRAVHATPVVVEMQVPEEPIAHACGEPVYQQLADGTITVVYAVCEGTVVEVTAEPEVHGVTVDHIEPPAGDEYEFRAPPGTTAYGPGELVE